MSAMKTPLDVLFVKVARVGFQHYERQGAPPLEELDITTQLAVLLAHERAEGEQSFYSPYIRALPRRAPCAWAMTDSELELAIAAAAHSSVIAGGLPMSTEEREAWRRESLSTNQSLMQHASALHERHAKFFNSEVSNVPKQNTVSYFRDPLLVLQSGALLHRELHCYSGTKTHVRG